LDIVEQATKIIDEAQKNKIVLRALGGTAIGMRCPSAKHRSLIRDYADIDLVGHAKQDKAIKNLFSSLGYEPNKMFNALHGRKRLQFFNVRGKISVDIFLDVFEMCHKFNFKDRLELDQYTIPLADLLMTKLQVVQINEKDVRDIVVILKDHEYGSRDTEKIDLDYIAKLCSEDWGLWKTLSTNVEKISKMVTDYGLSQEDTRKVKSKASVFLRNLDETPKSMRWRMRATIGERTPWYETVEEVKR
jgi:hypothetical protein